MSIILCTAIWVALLSSFAIGSKIDEIFKSLNDPLGTASAKVDDFNVLSGMESFEALKLSGHFYFFGNEIIVPNYEKSLQKYEKAFELSQQDGDVLFMLGLMYSYGLGCPLDIVKGTMYFHFAAKLGNVPAMGALGFGYRYGIGVEKKCSNAKIYYYKAAKRALKNLSSKDAISRRNPVRLSLKPVDSQAEAMEYYEYSAKTGDSSALFLLAQLYYFGTDATGSNLERARHFFEEAAKAGNDAAYGFLGMMYYHGEGVNVDYETAKLYFSIASEKNVAVAVNGLGLLYWHGYGVEKDIFTAEILFKRASDLKYAEAYYNHAMVLIEQASLFASEQIFQDILTASKAGFVRANLELVKRYLKTDTSCIAAVHSLRQVLEKGEVLAVSREAYGLYMKGHQDQALSRYIYLAAQGIEMANYNAAFILEHSDDRKHYSRSMFFYSRSALLENSASKTKLGNALFSSDPVAAASFFYAAARNQVPSAEAMFNLAYSFEYGLGLEKDLYSAIDMYLAANNKEKFAYIAVNLNLVRCYAKLWLQACLQLFKNLKEKTLTENTDKTENSIDKWWTMLLTLLFTCFIYWYINFYQIPRPAPPLQPAPRPQQPQSSPESVDNSLAQSESEGETSADSVD